MFKFMLNQYDSHTRMFFSDNKYLPIKIRFIDNVPYIVDYINSNDKCIGSKIVKINGIDINDIIMEMDKIICYASSDYLKIVLEKYLVDSNIIKSLPIINI